VFAGCSGGGTGGAGGGQSGGSGGGQAAGDTLKGATADILQDIMDKAGATLGEADAMPGTFTDPITAENAPGMIGLTPDDFVSFVDEATGATGALNVQAFQVAVVKCNEAQEAGIINEMIQASYDSGKWICVFPEQSLTMISGSYLLLAVGRTTETDALAEAFKSAAGGNVQGPYVFYTGETGGGDFGEDFGGGLGLEIGIEDIGDGEVESEG